MNLINSKKQYAVGQFNGAKKRAGKIWKVLTIPYITNKKIINHETNNSQILSKCQYDEYNNLNIE